MKTTIDYKQLHLTPIEELIDADFGKPGTAERKEFDRIIGTGSSTRKSEPMYLSPVIL